MIEHVLQDMNEVISNNYSDSHKAVDIVSNDHSQDEIIALESGIVEEVVKNVKSTNHNTKGLSTYGNYVKIKQSNGKTTLYAHMKYGSVNVNIGDYVDKGAIIGTMGNTGNAYGNHLHLEIRNENGEKENPLVTLNEKKDIKNEEIINEPINKIENQSNQTSKETNNIQKKEVNNKQDAIKNEYIGNSTYNKGSIVDALKEINIDSSYSYRKKLASANGIENYHGSYEQNVNLLKLLKEEKLKKA